MEKPLHLLNVAALLTDLPDEKLNIGQGGTITVVKADFLSDYRIKVHFSDGTQRVTDFANAFSQLQSYYAQYHQPELFQTFTINSGNLVWSEDWALFIRRGICMKARLGERW